MEINYAVSLWNVRHYANAPSLERSITFIRDQGYGVELWGQWQDEPDLYDPMGRQRLKHVVEGMKVSLHTAGADTFDLQKKHIDAASYLGAELIVLHPGDLAGGENSRPDLKRARDAVDYATDRDVKLALENGPLPFLVEAIENVDGLGICLDVGHVYFTAESLDKYLDALKHRLIHLHLQDILTQAETNLPATGKDHYLPGTGGIPSEDWQLLARTLKEIDFRGMAVFEIRPRNVFQTALLGTDFMRKLLDN